MNAHFGPTIHKHPRILSVQLAVSLKGFVFHALDVVSQVFLLP